MHPVVAIEGQERRQDRDSDQDRVAIPSEQIVQSSHYEKCADDVETDEIYQSRRQWEDDSAIAKLRAALDHLRESHDGSLGGMKRHENRSDQDSEDRG